MQHWESNVTLHLASTLGKQGCYVYRLSMAIRLSQNIKCLANNSYALNYLKENDHFCFNTHLTTCLYLNTSNPEKRPVWLLAFLYCLIYVSRLSTSILHSLPLIIGHTSHMISYLKSSSVMHERYRIGTWDLVIFEMQ